MAEKSATSASIPDGAACNCGSRGCLKPRPPPTGLIRHVKENQFEEVLSKVKNDAGIPMNWPSKLKKETPKAQEYWNRFGRAIGLALAALLNTLNLKLVLLGGGLAKSFSLFYPALEEELQSRAYPGRLAGVEFRTSQLWEEAGYLRRCGQHPQQNRTKRESPLDEDLSPMPRQSGSRRACKWRYKQQSTRFWRAASNPVGTWQTKSNRLLAEHKVRFGMVSIIAHWSEPPLEPTASAKPNIILRA